MRFKDYRYLLLSDLYRHSGSVKYIEMLKNIFTGEAYKYTFWMRTCSYTRENIFLKYTIYPLSRMFLNHYSYKFGISIPFYTKIGSGFYIGHFGCIVVNSSAIIGNNCNISQGVTIGITIRGDRKGNPAIGNNVYIGPGAKIIGGITIGNNVAIGANCVVTKNVPDDAVIVGVPGKVISKNGAKDYIVHTNYHDYL